MSRTPTMPQGFNFVTLEESLPQVCLQHKYYASIAPTSRQNTRNPRYLSGSFKKHRCLRNDLKKIDLFRSRFIAAVTFCIALYLFFNFPRFPQVLKNSSFNLESLGPNPAKHLSTGIAPLHSLFMLVF